MYQYLIVMLSPGSPNAVVLASERLASEKQPAIADISESRHQACRVEVSPIARA